MNLYILFLLKFNYNNDRKTYLEGISVKSTVVILLLAKESNSKLCKIFLLDKILLFNI